MPFVNGRSMTISQSASTSGGMRPGDAKLAEIQFRNLSFAPIKIQGVVANCQCQPMRSTTFTVPAFSVIKYPVIVQAPELVDSLDSSPQARVFTLTVFTSVSSEPLNFPICFR